MQTRRFHSTFSGKSELSIFPPVIHPVLVPDAWTGQIETFLTAMWDILYLTVLLPASGVTVYTIQRGKDAGNVFTILHNMIHKKTSIYESKSKYVCIVVVWHSGNFTGHINKVTLHQAWLVLGWAYHLGILTKSPRSTQSYPQWDGNGVPAKRRWCCVARERRHVWLIPFVDKRVGHRS